MRGGMPAIALFLLLAGCSGTAFVDTKRKVAAMAGEVQGHSAEAAAAPAIPAGQVRTHRRAYGGGRAVINDHGEPLPPGSDHFLLNTKGVGLQLRELATEINAQTGLPVDVMDDLPDGLSGGRGRADADCRMAPAYQGSLSRFLDGLGTYCDVTWKFFDGRLKVQIYETESYRLYAVPSLASIKSSMISQGLAPTSGSANGATGGTAGGTTATGQSLEADVTITSELKSWEEIKTILSALVKPGIVAVSPSEHSVVIIGRHSAQIAAKRLLTEINRRQLRQVEFTIQVLNLTTSEDMDLGLSLTALYNQLHGQYQVSGATPVGLAMRGAGSLAVTVQNNTLTNKTNKFATSNAIVSALQNMGNVATRDTLTVSARDGRPAPVTVARQLAYVASATTSTTTIAALGGLQEATLTIGLTMQLLPIVLDDGQILLQYAFGLSSLNALSSVTSNGITLQTPDINVRSSLQEAVISSGDALVLLGYQQDSLDQSDQGIPGIADSLFGFLGGSKTVSNAHSALVIIITPNIRENRISGT